MVFLLNNDNNTTVDCHFCTIVINFSPQSSLNFLSPLLLDPAGDSSRVATSPAGTKLTTPHNCTLPHEKTSVQTS